MIPTASSAAGSTRGGFAGWPGSTGSPRGADLPPARGLFKTIVTCNERMLGVHARVVRGGVVRAGARVTG
ncbi:hypothetical protein [Amycolatopsis sp. NPDC059021]|uniref:hypothetical protein n=1 Tax=Amycolatopsis sp. NPDC059021 TaxID=3346704 RepID=UPI00366A6BD2